MTWKMAKILLTLTYCVLLLEQVQAYPEENWIFDEDYWEKTYSELERSSDNEYPFCEDSNPLESFSLCNYRGSLTPEQIYQWWVNFGCFQYTHPSLINQNVPSPNITLCNYRNLTKVPCFIINTDEGTKCIQLDRTNEFIKKELFRVMISPDVYYRWRRCTVAAMKCCKEVLIDAVPEDGYCPPVWDAWSCYDEGKPGELSRQICPEFAYSNSGPACHHYSQKMCYQNGTWNHTTNYGTCSITSRLLTRVNIHIACMIVSIVVGIPAVFVLSCYRRLRARRLALHRNLLAAIILRNILVVISKSVVIIDELTSSSGSTVMSRNEFPCKLLATMEKFASSTAFACMLIDGIFLHRTIVAVFKKELDYRIVYSVVGAFTVIPVIIWVCLMSTMNDQHCWVVYEVDGVQWVLDGPRIAMLGINTLLLIDILRIILTKLKRSENSNHLSTTKAALFLMPLFGVQFLLTAWRPNTTSCELEQSYYIFTYVMDGLQGVMVALLYCYLNKEVHTLLRATYKKTETVVSARFRSEPRRRATAHNFEGRRDTFTTMVENKPNEEDENTNQAEEPTVQQVTPDTSFKALVHYTNVTSSEVPQTVGLSPSTPEFDELDVNSLTILDKTFSPSEDGFINIDFEYDVSPKMSAQFNRDHELYIPPFTPEKRRSEETKGSISSRNFDVWSENRAFEEDIPKIYVTPYENVYFDIKPPHLDVLSNNSNVEGNYSKRSTIDANEKKSYDSDDYEIVADIKNNQAKRGFEINNNESDLKDDKVVPDGKEWFYHSNLFFNGDFKPIADHARDINLTGGSLDDYGSVSDFTLADETGDSIDAAAIFDETLKKSLPEEINGEGSDDCDDIYIDPTKLCPNRPTEEKIIFLK